MNEDHAGLVQWLSGFGLDSQTINPDSWDPGFEAERRIVHARLGFFEKIYLRPENFSKRFYHSIYPLAIASWTLSEQTELYNGFCHLEAKLDIKFQATGQYASANPEFLEDINGHIKNTYDGLVRDAIHRGILELNDGTWVETGLHHVEQHIANSVNELLALQNIQCRTFCKLTATFVDIPEDSPIDARFAQENVYLSIIKKSFEFKEKQQLEQLRQEQALEHQKLLQKQSQLQVLNHEAELERRKSAQAAENFREALQDQEQAQKAQFDIETRLHEDKVKHQQALKIMAWQAEQAAEASLLAQKRESEKHAQEQQAAHESQLKEQAMNREISEYETQQMRWNEAKERMHLENLKREQRLKELDLKAELESQEAQQLAREEMAEKLLADKINYEMRLKEIEFSAQLEEKQKRFAATENADEYLRREIELLILERQRAELSQQIKQAENRKQE
jgi:hypothetical protein